MTPRKYLDAICRPLVEAFAMCIIFKARPDG
jgi:hypothetical protein